LKTLNFKLFTFNYLIMIGIFDSGLGGLIAFKEIQKVLPNYAYTYLGDTLRSPYGGRSQEAVYEFTEKAVDFLFQKGCKLVIVACNTASSEALRKLQIDYLPKLKDKSKNILGVVRPITEEAVEISKTKRIGVVGTKATIASNVYEKELQNLDKEIKVFQKACPLLVPLIEENYINRPETKKILKNYLRSLKNDNIDTLILGCTHYPILLKEFKRIMGEKVRVIDSSKILASKLKDYLERHSEIEKVLEKKKKQNYLVTDLTQNFTEMSQRILGKKVKFEKVDID
jgi:glutamate racemase